MPRKRFKDPESLAQSLAILAQWKIDHPRPKKAREKKKTADLKAYFRKYQAEHRSELNAYHRRYMHKRRIKMLVDKELGIEASA